MPELPDLGKRLVFEFPRERFLVLHLMIAGRLRWKKKGAKAPGRVGLATFDFPDGTLLLTEAGTKRRASLHAVEGRAGLEPFIRGGLEPELREDRIHVRRQSSALGSDWRITRSSARSPIRDFFRGSGMPIPTRSCIGRSSRLSSSPAS